jgi:hypothetical protein
VSKLPCPIFSHHGNPDGTIDSICSLCFKTIATEATEADLRGAEEAHVCSGFELERITYPPHRK